MGESGLRGRDTATKARAQRARWLSLPAWRGPHLPGRGRGNLRTPGGAAQTLASRRARRNDPNREEVPSPTGKGAGPGIGDSRAAVSARDPAEAARAAPSPQFRVSRTARRPRRRSDRPARLSSPATGSGARAAPAWDPCAPSGRRAAKIPLHPAPGPGSRPVSEAPPARRRLESSAPVPVPASPRLRETPTRGRFPREARPGRTSPGGSGRPSPAVKMR